MKKFRLRWEFRGKEHVKEIRAATARDARQAFDAYGLPGALLNSVEPIEPEAPTLKEAGYPLISQGPHGRGRPDTRYYTDSLEYYIQMYEQYLATLEGKRGPGYEIELASSRGVHAQWGLIAKGAAATSYALSLLERSIPEAREDGAGILAELGRDEAVVDKLIERLASESETTARDSIVLALGQLGNKKAVPSLAAIIRDVAIDVDTKWTAIESLGLIVHKRFLKQDNPVKAAIAWLDTHGPFAG